MDIRKVKKLIELLEESGIDELEIKEGEESVRISRHSKTPAQQFYAPAPMQQAPAAAPAPRCAGPPAGAAFQRTPRPCPPAAGWPGTAALRRSVHRGAQPHRGQDGGVCGGAPRSSPCQQSKAASLHPERCPALPELHHHRAGHHEARGGRRRLRPAGHRGFHPPDHPHPQTGPALIFPIFDCFT